MPTNDDRQLIRHLHGELDPAAARALGERLEREPDLQARLGQLRDVWEADPGALPALGQDFRDGVLERARRIRGGELSWSLAPAWARAGTAAALVLGVTLGFSLGGPQAASTAVVPDEPAVAAEDLSDDDVLDAFAVPSLADNYWQALGDEDDGETS